MKLPGSSTEVDLGSNLASTAEVAIGIGGSNPRPPGDGAPNVQVNEGGGFP